MITASVSNTKYLTTTCKISSRKSKAQERRLRSINPQRWGVHREGNSKYTSTVVSSLPAIPRYKDILSIYLLFPSIALFLVRFHKCHQISATSQRLWCFGRDNPLLLGRRSGRYRQSVDADAHVERNVRKARLAHDGRVVGVESRDTQGLSYLVTLRKLFWCPRCCASSRLIWSPTAGPSCNLCQRPLPC